MAIRVPVPLEERKKVKLPKWDVGEFDQDVIDAAVDLAQKAAKFFYPATPDLIPAFWPIPDDVPTIRDLDFGHLTEATVTLDKLKASQNWLNLDRLLWHLQHPGVTAHPNPFTSMPIIMSTAGGPLMIVDGHHRLGALLLLGAEDVPVWMLPAPTQPQE